MQPDTFKRLEDARVACVRISRFVAGKTKVEFIASDLLRSAVERQVEIIGESLGRAASADPDVEAGVPDLRRIVGMRNRLIHGYDEVDYNIVWDVVTLRIPELLRQLEHAMALADPPPSGPTQKPEDVEARRSDSDWPRILFFQPLPSLGSSSVRNPRFGVWGPEFGKASRQTGGKTFCLGLPTNHTNHTKGRRARSGAAGFPQLLTLNI